ncbi:MAG: molybdenum cofactor biosynthesis protein MoaE [Anaerolineae bacterium]
MSPRTAAQPDSGRSARVGILVRLFAAYREAAGVSETRVSVPAGSTPDVVWSRVVADHPSLGRFGGSVVAAVNGRYAGLDRALADGDELAFLPPVSGGVLIRIVEDEIDLDELIAAVRSDEMGAICTFQGTVRRLNRGREVERLEYEAYAEMASRVLREIVEEIQERWGTDRVAIMHRLGRLIPGEVSVAIAVAAPHRVEAFAACRHAIDRLKAVVPIWKKEVWKGGEEWMEEGASRSSGPASRLP